MKKRFVVVLLFAGLILIAGIFVSWQTANSQTVQDQLTLAYIVGKLAVSDGFPIEVKNASLINNVNRYGVSFELSTDDEKVLRGNGANDELIKIIKEKAPKAIKEPTLTPIQTPINTPTPVEISTPTPLPTPTPILTGKELTKEQLLTGLTNKEFSLAGRNETLIEGVKELGVNFELTSDIEQELRTNGATRKLIDTIRNNGPFRSVKPVEKSGTVTTVVTKSIGMEMVFVKPGQFKMGTNSMDKVRDKNGKLVTNSDLGRGYEHPAHSVTISKGFWMGKYEVTQEEWEKVTGLTIRKQRDKNRPNPEYNPNPNELLFGDGPKYPMYYVSWYDAQEFVKKLNAMDSEYVYSLPSEAEWEYACRAGTTGDYGGTEKLDEMGWYINNSGNSGKLLDAETEWDKAGNSDAVFIENFLKPNQIEGAHEVGKKLGNKFGLYDMHGNVWEWCQDVFKTDYVGAKNDGSPNLDNTGIEDRVLRGGAWNRGIFPVEELLRSAYRYKANPKSRQLNYGLRVVARPKASL